MKETMVINNNLCYNKLSYTVQFLTKLQSAPLKFLLPWYNWLVHCSTEWSHATN